MSESAESGKQYIMQKSDAIIRSLSLSLSLVEGILRTEEHQSRQENSKVESKILSLSLSLLVGGVASRIALCVNNGSRRANPCKSNYPSDKLRSSVYIYI